MNNMDCLDDESDGTISLHDCSLTSSIINNAAEEGAGRACSDQEEEHYFEFCSEEWSHSMISSSEEYFSAENIVFCGRIIASDEPTSQFKLQNLTITNKINKEETKRDGKLPVGAAASFRWDGSHNQIRKAAEMSVIKKEINHELRKEKRRPSSWSLFFFLGGIRRFQSDEMVLRDIRSRQSRLGTNPTLFRLDNTNSNGGDKKKMSCRNGGGRRRRDRRRQGFWWLWKAVSESCGGHRRRDNSVVQMESAGGCIPRL